MLIPPDYMGPQPPEEPEAPLALPPPPLAMPSEKPKLTDDEYVNFYMTRLEEAKLARRKHEVQWDNNYALYTNRIMFPNKLPWQSKGYVPKTAEMVDAKRALIGQALFRSRGRYFDAQPWGDDGKESEFAQTINRVLRFILNEIDFDDQILPPQLVMAQLANCVMKTYVTRDAYGRLRHQVDPIPPWNFYLDPLSRGQYCIHVSWMDLSEFREMALAAGSPYDRAVVLRINEDFRESERVDEQARREGLLPEGRSRKMVQLDEYYGNIDSPSSSERLHTNYLMTIVNHKHLVRRPEKNRFPGGRKPFVYGAVRRAPFTSYQTPPFSDVAPLARALNEYFNGVMDAALLRSIPSFEAFFHDFEHPQLILQGYSPGKMFFRKRSATAAAPLIRPIDLGTSKGDDIRIYQLLQSELGNRVMSQAELGTPGGGKPTATEFAGKSQLTQQFTVMEAQELEAQILEPLFERMVANEIWYRRRYRDDAQLMSALSDDDAMMLESLSESERKDMSERLRIKVSGISGMLAAEETATAIDNLINRLGRAVKSDPTGQIAMRINWKGMAELYAEQSGIPKSAVWMTDEDLQRTQQEQMALQAQQMQFQQQMQQQMAPQLPPGQPQEQVPEGPPQMQMIPGGMA